MKESELRACAICALCAKPIGASGVPLFWRVTVERFGVDLRAIRRQDGLAAVLGGHAALAQVMGPNDDMTVTLMQPVKLTVCETCAMEQRIAMIALERASEPDVAEAELRG